MFVNYNYEIQQGHLDIFRGSNFSIRADAPTMREDEKNHNGPTASLQSDPCGC